EFTSVCLGTFLKEFYTAVFNPAVCERAAFRCSKISCGEALKQDGRFAIIGRHFGHRRIWPEGRTPVMTDVTILFLDGTFPSTAVGPMEVFRHAGMLWNLLTGKRAAPRFRVTTVSVDGRTVRCDAPIRIQTMAALEEIRHTELIFISSA